MFTETSFYSMHIIGQCNKTNNSLFLKIVRLFIVIKYRCVLTFECFFFVLLVFSILFILVSYWLCILCLKRSMLRIPGVSFVQSSSQSQRGSQEKALGKEKIKRAKKQHET